MSDVEYQVTGFLCETTIMDQENRASLIGIMPGALQVPGLPILFPAAAFVRISPLPPVNTPVHIEILLEREKLAEFSTTSVESPDIDVLMPALHVVLGRIPLTIASEGILRLTASIDGDEARIVTALRISQLPQGAS